MFRTRSPMMAIGLFLVPGVLGTSCANKQLTGPVPVDLIPPTTNLHMRATFDTNPSTFLGRFMPREGLRLLDESSARKTECSEYITWQEIDAGGVSHDDIFQVSGSVALGFTIPNSPVDVAGEADGVRSLRAQYRLTSKMVADVTDPIAFGLCCQKSAEACPGEFVSEFVGPFVS